MRYFRTLLVGLSALVSIQSAEVDRTPMAGNRDNALECMIDGRIEELVEDHYQRMEFLVDDVEALRENYCSALSSLPRLMKLEELEEAAQRMEETSPREIMLGIILHELGLAYQDKASLQDIGRRSRGDIIFYLPREDIEKNLKDSRERSKKIEELDKKARCAYRESARILSAAQNLDARFEPYLRSSLEKAVGSADY